MRKYLVATSVAALAVSLAACGSGSSSSASGGTSGGSLSLGQIQPPTTFVPGGFGSGPTAQFLQPVYDTLVRSDNSGDPTPNIATAWTYDSPQTTLSMTLRSGVTFTDGTPLDATAVKTDLEAAKKGTGESGGQLKYLDHVDVVDPTHVTIVLSAPDPSFLPNMGGVAGMLASPKALTNASLKTVPVGSGPYTLDRGATQAGNKYVYTRNANYWNKQAFPYDKITRTVFSDSNAILSALQSKQLDGSVVGPKDIAAVKGAGLQVLSYPNYATAGLYIFDRQGKTVPALGNLQVRQALNYAFDRSAILKQAFGGEGTATAQLFNVESTAYEKSLDSKYSYDVSKAKALLAQAGYANGFTLPMPDVSPVFPQQQAAFTESLKAIGITPQYQPVNGQTFISDLLSGKYAASYFSLDNFRSWDTTQLALAPGALWNTFHIADPTVTPLIDQAQHQTGDAQTATFKKINEYVVDQAWFAPWAQSNNDYAHSSKVNVTAQKYAAYPPLYNYTPAG